MQTEPEPEVEGHANPYRPPDSQVNDVDSEESIRREGKYLVINLYGGLHSVCAHCSSARDLVARTAKVVCRNSVGCFSSLGLFVLAALTAVSAEHIALPDVVVGWVVIIAGIGMVVVNVVWRVELNYSLCLDCRAKRGRWILGGLLVDAQLSRFSSLLIVVFYC